MTHQLVLIWSQQKRSTINHSLETVMRFHLEPIWWIRKEVVLLLWFLELKKANWFLELSSLWASLTVLVEKWLSQCKVGWDYSSDSLFHCSQVGDMVDFTWLFVFSLTSPEQSVLFQINSHCIPYPTHCTASKGCWADCPACLPLRTLHTRSPTLWSGGGGRTLLQDWWKQRQCMVWKF